MKYIILLIALIVSFSSCGTDQGESIIYKYTVINDTGKLLTIKSYLSNYPDVAPIITSLNNGQELTKTYKDGLPPKTYYFANFFGENDPKRDSIVVIYNNEKINFFNNNCSNNRNPLNLCIYHKTEETFIFTEEDYNNAEDCNGNCE